MDTRKVGDQTPDSIVLRMARTDLCDHDASLGCAGGGVPKRRQRTRTVKGWPVWVVRALPDAPPTNPNYGRTEVVSVSLGPIQRQED